MKTKLKLEPEVSTVSKTVQQAIKTISENSKVSKKLIFRMELILEEILTNICIHGESKSQIQITIKSNKKKDKIILFIYDSSPIEFDQSNHEYTKIKFGERLYDENNRVIGNGLKLINRFVGFHRHRFCNQHNINMVGFNLYE